MSAYYNENDPFAASWLRELIAAGLIVPGDVDERSITEVQPDDVKGYTQAHFFAGIGGWSLALRLAGWGDDRPVWTGSCPCQPFSAAGKGKGESDPRHLWPEFRRLIAACKPAVTFGEQVASKAGRSWLSRVRADLEGMGYGFGAADLCAAGVGEEAEARVRCGDSIQYERIIVGAPHIRQRLWWVADSAESRHAGTGQGTSIDRNGENPLPQRGLPLTEPAGRGSIVRLADDSINGCGQGSAIRGRGNSREHANAGTGPLHDGDAFRLANADGRFSGDRGLQPSGKYGQQPQDGGSCGLGTSHQGFWSAFDLVYCRDEKSRRIEPGTFPLAHGVPARVVRLRGYGNAINPYTAAEFIQAFQDVIA